MNLSGTSSARHVMAGALAIAITLVLAGCFNGADEQDNPPPVPASAFVDCATLTALASPRPSAAATSGLAVKLPDLTLPCAADGTPVSLRQLRGPLVINLWASWCAPCRAELPALQRLAASGSVPVLGIITSDDRTRAAWLNHDLGITFPSLTDSNGSLQGALGEKLLPLTVIVRADGELVIHRAPVLDDELLRALVAEHLGVA